MPTNATALPPVGALGSGSDFSAFLDHLCVPSSDLSFSGDPGYYGVYHSLYDSFSWVQRFTGFEHHAAMAHLWGTLALALADELVHARTVLGRLLRARRRRSHHHAADGH